MQRLFGIHPRREFGEMDEPLNAILDAGKSPKGGNLGDDAGDNLARGVALLHRGPGIHLGPLDGESNLLLFFIDAEHLHFDLLTDVQDFTGMIDTTPGQLADMHQSIRASQVHKGPKIGKVTDDPMTDFAGLQFVEQFFPATLPPMSLLVRAFPRSRPVLSKNFSKAEFGIAPFR